ncbi:hypothetical protein EVAR_59237_1 [Eumeta japonica]|uniref:Uncharacterized protein n=1 Tax=Eumeta variegata TaxID=151549 RepID=A0A4C1ZDF7_EUMVA|nr:hypothetical protein EVAR_59237_1 [Eumeta japonica]
MRHIKWKIECRGRGGYDLEWKSTIYTDTAVIRPRDLTGRWTLASEIFKVGAHDTRSRGRFEISARPVRALYVRRTYFPSGTGERERSGKSLFVATKTGHDGGPLRSRAPAPAPPSRRRGRNLRRTVWCQTQAGLFVLFIVGAAGAARRGRGPAAFQYNRTFHGERTIMSTPAPGAYPHLTSTRVSCDCGGRTPRPRRPMCRDTCGAF